jgi:hypothetical protein
MPMKYPKGFAKSNTLQIAVRFPEPFFREIISLAKRENKSFNAMVVELAKLGKFDLDESDRLEPQPHHEEAA